MFINTGEGLLYTRPSVEMVKCGAASFDWSRSCGDFGTTGVQPPLRSDSSDQTHKQLTIRFRLQSTIKNISGITWFLF